MVERIEINLLPAEYRIHRRKITLAREIVYPLLVFLISWIGIGYYTLLLDSQISILKNDIKGIENELHKNRHIKNEIKRLRNEKEQFNQKIRALKRIDVNKEKWVRFMEILCARIPRFTWISSVEEKGSSRGTSLYIQGQTYSFPEVANFMTKLEESDYILSVGLSTIEHMEKNRSFSFSLSAKINPDVKLTKSSGDAEQADGK